MRRAGGVAARQSENACGAGAARGQSKRGGRGKRLVRRGAGRGRGGRREVALVSRGEGGRGGGLLEEDRGAGRAPLLKPGGGGGYFVFKRDGFVD